MHDLKVNEMSFDGFSLRLKEIANALTETYQCPQSYVVMGMIMATSSAIRKKIIIDSGKYKNNLCLYVAIVGKSGANKSAIQNLLLAPLKNMDTKFYEEYKSEYEIWIKEGKKENEPVNCKQLLVSDITSEYLYQSLSDNKLGVTMYADEIKSIIDNLGRYNSSTNGEISRLLSIWSGETFSIGRKSKPLLFVENPFLNLYGTIQPDLLATTFGKDILLQNGFTARFLFVYPEEQTMPMYNDAIVPESIMQNWSGYIHYLVNDLKENRMELDKEAKEIYKEWYNEIQKKIEDEEEDFLRAMYSKLQINILRLSGIVHFMSENFENTTTVSVNDMEFAIRLIRCLEIHNLKTFELLKKRHFPLTKEQVIGILCQKYPKCNKSQLAKVLGVERSFVSRAASAYS